MVIELKTVEYTYEKINVGYFVMWQVLLNKLITERKTHRQCLQTELIK